MRKLCTALLLCSLILAPVRVQGQTVPRAWALDLINDQRASQGCDRLQAAGQSLLDSARLHSRKMARRGYIYHTLHLHLSHWSLVGEVVGVGRSVRQIVRLLFESPPHRKILLDCRYDVAAIGLYFNDQVWMTGRFYAR